jgi:hypothetical protein
MQKSQDCHDHSEVSHVHDGQQRDHHSYVKFYGQDCSDKTSGIACYLRETATKGTKMQCDLIYLSNTSMGDKGNRR